MTDTPSLLDLAHRATHRLPGVPTHRDRPSGHHGSTRHGRRANPAHHSADSPNHSPDRPARVLVAWQRRIAVFFGRGPR